MVNSAEEFFHGVIKVYFPLKGFGFITRPKGRDLFFFRTEFADETLILEGNSVKFKVEAGDKGDRAVQIARNG